MALFDQGVKNQGGLPRAYPSHNMARASAKSTARGPTRRA